MIQKATSASFLRTAAHSGLFRPWPLLLLAALTAKAILSIGLRNSPITSVYGGLIYFFLIVVATIFSTLNAIQDKHGSRPFWIFVSAGCWLWLLDQWLYIYYGFFLRTDIPDNSIADPALFLHIVPFMAAIVFAPHLSTVREKLYRPALNFLLLLFFWVFFYAYLVLPYQFLFPNQSIYNRRFDALYLIENLALVLVTGIVAFRSRAPWKPTYLHLFGACTVYLLSSSVSNLAIDQGIYSNQTLYAFGLDVASAWFVWSTIQWRDLSESQPLRQIEHDELRAVGPIWAMVVVVAIPIFGIWDLLRHNEQNSIRYFRLCVVLGSVVLLALAALLKDYFSERDLKNDARINRFESTLSRVALGQSEASRIEVETHYKELTETVPAIVWRADPATSQVRFVSPQVNEILGYAAEMWTRDSGFWLRSIHPEDRERILALTTGTITKSRYDFEFRMIAADGRTVWLRTIVNVAFENNQPTEVVGVSSDITERVRAQEAVKKSEEKFSKAFRESPLAISITSAKTHRYIDINETHERLTGHKREEILGRSVFDINLWADPTRRIEFVNRLLREGSIRDEELRFLSKSGKELIVLASAELIEINGEPCILGVAADITERKRAERMLLELSGRLLTAQEEERCRIARELHDDIGQELALLAVQAHEDDDNNNGSHSDELSERVKTIASRLSRLSHQLHSSELEFLGLTVAVESLCRNFTDQYGVEVQCRCQDVPTSLDGNLSLCFYRVVQEALHNAVKHSKSDTLEIELSVEENRLYLSVRDFGVGFEIGPRLYASGLGLVSMRERMRSVGGTFNLWSKPGEGTLVEVSAPLAASAAA